MASNLALALGSLKTNARMLSRSNAPCALTMADPKAFSMAGIACPPLAVVAREIASASIQAAPMEVKIWATLLLPLPMPPVTPSRKGGFFIIPLR